MNPLFFGHSEAPLYGVHQPARPDAQAAVRDEGVVLCNAFGQEYMRAHRAYRQLALLLNRKGFHVLRFDYRGSGDSSGQMDGVSADDWVADIGLAVEELREVAGVRRVSLLGMRLGALLAASACAARTDIERLVLWDPVASGLEYERELQAEIARERPSEYTAPSGNGEGAQGELNYNGFTMPASFRASLRGLGIAAAATAPVSRLLLAVSHESERFAAIREGLRAHPGFRYQFTAAPHDWNYVDNFGGILLPQPVIQSIVRWMEAP